MISVPVACIADKDVMPDCAPLIMGLTEDGDALPEKTDRRWRVKADFAAGELEAHTEAIRQKADGQKVKTFVSDEWTLEYDLAHAGLAQDVWVAAHLAKADEQINAGTKDAAAVAAEAEAGFAALGEGLGKQEWASRVYALFTTGTKASKAIAAQYLADHLEKRVKDGSLSADGLKAALPAYLKEAIEYVTNGPAQAEAAAEDGAGADGK